MVSIKGVLRINDRFLLCMNHRQEWELPGGQPDVGEQPRTTCARELSEETGISVEVAERPLLAQNFEVIPGQWVLIVAYSCTPVGSATITTSHEHTAIKLFTQDEALTLDNLPQVYKDAIAIGIAS